LGGVVGGVIVWSTTSTSSRPDAEGACRAVRVADKVLPSVVTIQVRGASGADAGTGSGEFFRSGGYVLTNNHVIAAGANRGSVTITFHDGETVPARIVGRDVLTDLAVVQVRGTDIPPVIALGDSQTLSAGQPVVALGAPLGLSSTVTGGIVSALARIIQVPTDTQQVAVLADAIQTDAAINPGNSGGALVDCEGRLVGVPTAGATVPSPSGGSSGGSIGLGFAVPVTVAEAVANQIIDTGTVTHASFGLSAQPLSASAAHRTGVDEGLLVNEVQPNGPAAAAGIRLGDVITEIEGRPARSLDQLIALTITRQAGHRVRLTYHRMGHSSTVTVTLSQRPSTQTGE
jgi:putative serine protease PepD